VHFEEARQVEDAERVVRGNDSAIEVLQELTEWKDEARHLSGTIKALSEERSQVMRRNVELEMQVSHLKAANKQALVGTELHHEVLRLRAEVLTLSTHEATNERTDRDNLRLMDEKREAAVEINGLKQENERLNNEVLDLQQRVDLTIVDLERAQQSEIDRGRPSALFMRYTQVRIFARIRQRVRVEAMAFVIRNWLDGLRRFTKQDLGSQLVDQQMRHARACMRSAINRLIRQELQVEYDHAKSGIVIWRRQQRFSSFQPLLT